MEITLTTSNGNGKLHLVKYSGSGYSYITTGTFAGSTHTIEINLNCTGDYGIIVEGASSSDTPDYTLYLKDWNPNLAGGQ
jgi:hypothetical protein